MFKPKAQPVTLRGHLALCAKRNLKYFSIPMFYVLGVETAQFTYKIIDPIGGIQF